MEEQETTSGFKSTVEAEAEYMAMSQGLSEILRARNLLSELKNSCMV
jgi:hypothetical protein